MSSQYSCPGGRVRDGRFVIVWRSQPCLRCLPHCSLYKDVVLLRIASTLYTHQGVIDIRRQTSL